MCYFMVQLYCRVGVSIIHEKLKKGVQMKFKYEYNKN